MSILSTQVGPALIGSVPPGETTIAIDVQETNLQTDRPAPEVGLSYAYILQSNVPANSQDEDLECAQGAVACIFLLSAGPLPFSGPGVDSTDGEIPASGSATAIYYIAGVDQTIPVTDFYTTIGLVPLNIQSTLSQTPNMMQLPSPQ